MWIQIQSNIERLRAAWCYFMHASVRWPIHGWYECGTCGRRYPVPWHRNAPVHGQLRAKSTAALA